MVDDWEPAYSPWRHGGWYVHNVRYPSGAVGCVSRNYADRKWRIACDNRPGSFPGGPNDHTYRTRDEAARAERDIAREMHRHLRRREDDRCEVADTAEANRLYGCQRDTWCILENRHHGDCSDSREVWPGPDVAYEASGAP